MTKFLKLLAVVGALALSGAFFNLPSWAASADYFLKIDGIEGESTDSSHKDWINLLSVSGNLSEEASSSMASGKRQHKPFVITKELDKASPKLQEAATKGKVFPKVIIHVKANEGSSAYGGSRATYLKYELENVMITSYQVSGGGAAGQEHPMEEFSLNYEKIKFEGSDSPEKEKDKPARKER